MFIEIITCPRCGSDAYYFPKENQANTCSRCGSDAYYFPKENRAECTKCGLVWFDPHPWK